MVTEFADFGIHRFSGKLPLVAYGHLMGRYDICYLVVIG